MSETRNSPAVAWIRRHSLSVRICHWINVIAFAFLVLSGIHIFLDFPELYWGEVGFQGHPAVFRLADFGLSWEESDALGDRRWGRNYHFLFAWVFAINGLIYVSLNLLTRHFRRRMLPSRRELTFRNLGQQIRDHARFRAHKGEAARDYNTLQKLSYLLVIFVLFPFMFVNGLAQMPAMNAIAPWMIDLFGGRQTARTLHVVGTMALMLFLVVHIVEVLVVGAWNDIRAMITGKFALPDESGEKN
jgi:thiosulfate reductase cytochrome b subunit